MSVSENAADIGDSPVDIDTGTWKPAFALWKISGYYGLSSSCGSCSCDNHFHAIYMCAIWITTQHIMNSIYTQKINTSTESLQKQLINSESVPDISVI